MIYENLLKIIRPVKRALGDYNMIEEEGKIAVGISGGKDSITCLFALKTLITVLPVKYQLVAIAVDLGWDPLTSETNYQDIRKFCDHNNIEFHVESTNISDIIFNQRKESNPCSLCSRMRNGVLVKRALAEGCFTIALGHHMDDVIETTIMSMFFSGKIDSFTPKVYLDRQKVYFIRPLIYMREKDIASIAESYNLPIIEKKMCPADGNTARNYIKKLLQEQESYDEEIPVRIFSAIKNDIWKL